MGVVCSFLALFKLAVVLSDNPLSGLGLCLCLAVEIDNHTGMAYRYTPSELLSYAPTLVYPLGFSNALLTWVYLSAPATFTTASRRKLCMNTPANTSTSVLIPTIWSAI